MEMKVLGGSGVVYTLLTFVACTIGQQASNEGRDDSVREATDLRPGGAPKWPHLRVLLVSSYFVGHQIPMIAVGEELVSRGHNVTLFTTEVEGSNVVPQLVERVGITFLSAGPESRTREEFEAEWGTLRGKGLREVLDTMIGQQKEHNLRMRQGIDLLQATDWDIVLVDQAVLQLTRYISLEWSGIPVIMHMSTPLVFPSMEGQNLVTLDNNHDAMSIFDRLFFAVVYKMVMRIALWQGWRTILNSDPVLYDTLKDERSVFDVAGIANPFISTTTFGFEYSRSLYPTMHLVGPMLPREYPKMATDLEDWLARKPEKKVVYISMGSAAFLTKEMGWGLIEGITSAGYSAVWSLRESNRDILEGVELDRDRFFVSKWVSQLAVLQHRAIGVAILHGGMNGVHEAIFYNVPVIVIPFGMDQPITASRVQYQKLGIQLHSSEVTADRVAESIKDIQTGSYRERVEKQSKIFRFAGGARKAADILEHYADVGYEHLYPSFYKYNWNWVQYYNADVYLVFGLVLLIVSVAVYKLSRCVCRRCSVGTTTVTHPKAE